jgi:hypothetical protein
MAESAPPGWYPDPRDPSRRLWWDGQSWGSPVPVTPLLPSIVERRRPVLSAATAAALLGFGLLGTAILILGAPSDPCRGSEPCGPEPGAVAGTPFAIAFSAVVLLAAAVLPKRLNSTFRLTLALAASVGSVFGWVMLVRAW